MKTIKDLTIKELQRYIDDLDSLMQTGWFPNKKVTDYTFYHKNMSLREFISKGREIIRVYLMNEIKSNKENETMKTIKLTVEHARELFSKMPETRTTILHEFTDEELGIKPKPFKWEDLDGINGCKISHDSTIRCFRDLYHACNGNRNTYPCGEDAQQALARCMVLQLAYHYNGCHQHEIKGDCYKCYYEKGELRTIRGDMWNDIIKFLRKEDLQKCIDDNEELFKTMLGVRD